eukprot:3182060-Alexandrium_andersonii.AAC.1
MPAERSPRELVGSSLRSFRGGLAAHTCSSRNERLNRMWLSARSVRFGSVRFGSVRFGVAS